MSFKLKAVARLQQTNVTAAGDDSQAVMKSLGFKEDPRSSSSHGFYFITVYVFTAAMAKKGWSGDIELHVNAEVTPTEYEMQGTIKKPEGHSIKVHIKDSSKNGILGKLKKLLDE